jgi:hypothetical protein
VRFGAKDRVPDLLLTLGLAEEWAAARPFQENTYSFNKGEGLVTFL